MSEPEQSTHVPAPAKGAEPVTPASEPTMPGITPTDESTLTGIPSSSRWMRLSRGTVLALGVGIGAAVVGACWLSVTLLGGDEAKEAVRTPSATATVEESKASAPFGTDGTLILTEVGLGLDDGASCSGTGGYSDIDVGTQVNITDAAGTLVASGFLGLGEKTEDGCTFSFTVDDITPGSKLYTVEVSHRGGLTKSEAELRAGGLEFTLGD